MTMDTILIYKDNLPHIWYNLEAVAVLFQAYKGGNMEYISSIIEAVGVIIGSCLGALIAAGYIGKAFKSNITPLFRTYSDKSHNAHKIMCKAKNTIHIVAAIGDQLLETHETRILRYLKRGVKLYFLIQETSRYYELEHYINANTLFLDDHYDYVRNSTLAKLKKIQTEFPDLVEIREFPLFLSASYIGIDIDDNCTNSWPSHATIQVMLYQYAVEAHMCPITYFSYKDNQELFKSTASSILDMWSNGNELNL